MENTHVLVEITKNKAKSTTTKVEAKSWSFSNTLSAIGSGLYKLGSFVLSLPLKLVTVVGNGLVKGLTNMFDSKNFTNILTNFGIGAVNKHFDLKVPFVSATKTATKKPAVKKDDKKIVKKPTLLNHSHTGYPYTYNRKPSTTAVPGVTLNIYNGGTSGQTQQNLIKRPLLQRKP